MTTATTDPGLEPAVQASAEKLVQELASIDDQISKLNERRDEIKRTLGVLLPTGSRTVSGASVSITRPKRFNPGKFAAEYPIGQFWQCYDAKPSAAKVKAVLGADVYERFRVEAETPTVTVK